MLSSDHPGPVTPHDVDQAVDLAVAALSSVADRDWHVPAPGLDWDCWETLEHVADDLFTYAAQLSPRRPRTDTHVPFVWSRAHAGGPASTIFADPRGGPAGLVQVIEACGTLLAAVVARVPATTRSFHPYGASDPEGFAAMGVVETLVHLFDVAGGLGMAWEPPPDLCARALFRLFPDAPAGTDRWPTLLWATGRGELPGRPRLTSWQWDGAVRPH